MKLETKYLAMGASLLVLSGSTFPVACRTLTGNIRHEESLPPVAPELRAGTKFDEGLLPKPHTISKWFRIPSWMAGEWHRQTRTRHTPMGSVQVKDERTRKFGFQTDSMGAVWHWVRIPFSQINDLGSIYAYSVVRDESMVARSENSFTLRTIFTGWLIDKRTGIVRSVQQSDQIDEFFLQSNGRMAIRGSICTYDQFGQKKSIEQCSWFDTKIADYNPVNQFGTTNVRQLFAEYLASKGTPVLIPKD